MGWGRGQHLSVISQRDLGGSVRSYCLCHGKALRATGGGMEGVGFERALFCSLFSFQANSLPLLGRPKHLGSVVWPDPPATLGCAGCGRIPRSRGQPAGIVGLWPFISLVGMRGCQRGGGGGAWTVPRRGVPGTACAQKDGGLVILLGAETETETVAET
jgi:hypothetical protein